MTAITSDAADGGQARRERRALLLDRYRRTRDEEHRRDMQLGLAITEALARRTG
jgi:hypothetical protein